MPIVIRIAADSDLPAIQGIYAHHVLHGTASFEEVPPTVEELRSRMQGVRDKGLPYLVAEMNGVVVGYAYASLYRPRPAYRHTLENSVYVDKDSAGLGVGRALMVALIEICEKGPWRQMVAAIGDSANIASIRLHSAMGFEHAGLFKSVGFKHGRWLDSVLMQRALGVGDGSLPS
ncbi:GNAT family N-acetyltransferase [Lacibacterium aquatile]|uniref:GNAT family N-acetyltransferase n=1 Tax=Lacibacterium aquatile TaxID=1168082 RepID=A0ABW5DKE9_9PROT